LKQSNLFSFTRRFRLTNFPLSPALFIPRCDIYPSLLLSLFSGPFLSWLPRQRQQHRQTLPEQTLLFPHNRNSSHHHLNHVSNQFTRKYKPLLHLHSLILHLLLLLRRHKGLV
jgi:hypothetical protein